MKKFFVLGLLMLGQFMLNAQANKGIEFVDGWCLTKKGDTLRGKICIENTKTGERFEKIKFIDELLSMLNGSMTKDKQRIVNDLHMIKKLTDDYDSDKGMMLDDLLDLVINMYNDEFTALLKKYNLRDNDTDVLLYEKYNFVKKASDLPVFRK
jgi:hypothetical protein